MYPIDNPSVYSVLVIIKNFVQQPIISLHYMCDLHVLKTKSITIFKAKLFFLKLIY